jgi:MscS family membrane protein
MREMLQYVLLGRPAERWLLAAAFIVGGFLAGKLCSGILSALSKRGSSATASKLSGLILGGIRLPLAIALTLGGIRLGLDRLALGPTLSLWADRVIAICLILAIASGINKLSNAIIGHYVPSHGPYDLGGSSLLSGEATLQPLLQNFFNTLAWIIAGVLVLRVLGYNISALLAGLGLGGAALALASKDTLANFFGSITVFVDKPFRLGDRIKIGAYDGVVTEIGIRTSRLRTLEDRTVSLPNSLFAATPIENVSAAPTAKVTQTVRVWGGNSGEAIERGLALLRELHAAVPGIEGQPTAALASVGGLGCDITLIYHIAKNADYWAVLSAVNLEVLRRFEGAGIRLV